MPDMTLHFSSPISITDTNPSFVSRGVIPPYVPFSLGGVHIPQAIPTVGGWNHSSSRHNPRFGATGWSAQMGGQFTLYITSVIPSSSTLIPTNAFIMVTPPLCSGVPSGWIQFYSLGNPHHGFPLSGGNVYNPYHVASMGMVTLQSFMSQLGGGYYPTRHGHGIYQNPGWSAIPQPQSFPGAWTKTSQSRLTFWPC
jgi:hypothetical protein